MDEKIFRKEAMDKISSPEQMNDYIKVAKPGVWITLAAVMAFLIGFAVWGIFGTIESTTQAVVVSEGGTITLYVNENAVDSVTDTMTVEVNESQYAIDKVSSQTVNAAEVLNASGLHMGNMASGDWAYTATLTGQLEDGMYEATLITEKVNPIRFIIN